MAVLDSTGLTIRRYPEILNIINESLRANVYNDLDLGEDTYLGQISSIIAREFAQLEEVLQVIEDSKDRDKAEGTALDNLLYLIGLKRLGATRSSGEVYAICEYRTVIPAFTVLVNESNGDKFRTTTTTRALPEACRAVWCNVEDTTGDFVIHINDDTFTYTRLTGESVESVIDKLVGIINAADAHYTASREIIESGDSTLYVQTTLAEDMYVILGNSLNVHLVTVSMPTQMLEEGAIIVPPYAITAITSPITGVDTVFNPRPFGVGRGRETDMEFRLRASKELSAAGSATYSAVYTAMSNLKDVSNVLIIENDTHDFDVHGNPPHSFEVIIDIPDTQAHDESVAKAIWNEKPVGIQTSGSIGVTIRDNNDQQRVIKFSRPQQKYIATRVKYTTFDEEPLSNDLDNLIISSILEYGNSLTTGVDVIPRRFLSTIYKNTSGLGDVTVEVQALNSMTDTPNPLDWTESRLSISPREVPVFIEGNVIVEYTG